MIFSNGCEVRVRQDRGSDLYGVMHDGKVLAEYDSVMLTLRSLDPPRVLACYPLLNVQAILPQGDKTG